MSDSARENVYKAVMFVAVPLAIAMLQTVFAWRMELFGIKPNFLYMTVITGAVFAGAKTGSVTGAVLGIIVDVASARVVGQYTLMLLTLGFLAGYLAETELWRSLFSTTALFFATYGAMILGVTFFRALIFSDLTFFPSFFKQMAGEAIYSVLLLPIGYKLMERFQGRFSSLEWE